MYLREQFINNSSEQQTTPNKSYNVSADSNIEPVHTDIFTKTTKFTLVLTGKYDYVNALILKV